jgi:hypothetical protein
MEAQESLAIIEQMIARSKNKFKHNAKYFLLWGWGVFIAAAGQFILLQFLSSKSFYVWMTMPVCAVISIIMSLRDQKNQVVKTYTGDAMGSLWTAMGISFILMTVISFKMSFNPFSIFLILYGIGTFTSGRLIEFKPLVYGGLFAFGMSMVCLYTEGSYVYLVLAIAILGSYIIPGHLLLKAETHE